MEAQTRNDMFLITPMSQHFSLAPGEVYHGTLRIANPANSTEDFNFKVSVAPYGVIGEDYDADLTTNSVWNQIADWIEIEDGNGILAPNETRDVGFTITVPEDAPVGAQSAAIVVTQNKDEQGSESVFMDNIFEMASIIYADIEGDVYREGSILSNDIPFFSDTPKVVVGTVLNNNGNAFEEATISITVKNLISGETILPTDENNGVYTDIVVPKTQRNIKRNVEGLPFLGIVRIEQAVYYNNQNSIESRDILICPIWFMVLMAVTALLFILSFIKIHMLRKKRKRALVNI